MGEFGGGEIGERRLLAHQRGEVALVERGMQCPQPVGPLRMAGRHQVFQKIRVVKKKRRHASGPDGRDLC